MITLPATPAPNGVVPSYVDVGGSVRGATNAVSMRIDRPGGHYRAQVTYGIGTAATRAALIADLVRGKQEGLRLPYPLQGVDQSGSGAPVMDGADQAGRLIHLRGMTPGYVAGKGFWLSIEDASGQHYLHNIHVAGTVGGDGKVTVTLAEHLRVPFANGAVVHLDQPMIEGDVAGNEQSWQLKRGNRLEGIQFTVEEMA
ncbi:hypothetical protein ACFOKF_16585 [Sphingobium rhizovicinum]|uniref:Uncharacterized protein n=1 Tax=Sphingobium rhizovicinum TaxID=432308 RepID=A0ABV7NJ07_9SPHN